MSFYLYQIQRYAIVIVVLLAFLVLILLLMKLFNRYRQYREGAPSTSTRHLQPVGDRGLLVNARDASSKRMGFTAEQIPSLGNAFKYDALEGRAESEEERHADEEKGGNAREEKEEELRNECIVCLVEYEQGELLRKLHACGHFFHQDCVDAWLSTHRSCPICRTPLDLPENEPQEQLDTGAEVVPESRAAPVPVAE